MGLWSRVAPAPGEGASNRAVRLYTYTMRAVGRKGKRFGLAGGVGLARGRHGNRFGKKLALSLPLV